MSSPQKISQLTTAGPLTGAELVPIVQNGGTLQTTVSDFVALANVSLLPVVSALQTQINQVSALASANVVAIASISAEVSALGVRVNTVSAAVVSLTNLVGTYDTRIDTVSAGIVSVNSVVSALEVRVSAASATGVDNAAAITSTNAVVSTLQIQVNSVSASVSVLNVQMTQAQASISAINSVLATIDTSAITGLEVRVSTLEIRVANVSASVSALQVQLNAVSALTSVNAAAITSVNAVISSLAISVSADVSAKVNRIGDYMDSVQYIEFDTSTTITTSVGRLHWDIEYGTLDIGLAGGNSNVLIGQREVMYVYNNTSATLPKGKVVEVTGAQGQRLTVKLAQADNDANSATVLGIMLEEVSVNNSGYVATNGIVRNVDTGAFTDGQIVYLSPTSAGELTATKPIAPQHMVMIGYIVKGGSVGAGSIYVKTQNGYEIGELHDVKTSSSASIANNEVLAYNTSAGVWTNSTVLLDVQASVSALNIQVAAVSALTSVNAASITSANAVIAAVSALTSVNAANIAAVSALVSANTVAIASVSAAVSTLQVQVNAVSAAVSAAFVSIGQRVLKAGDTMSGELNMADNLVTRPKFKDYALTAIVKGSVSATTTLDMTEGNFFTALIAGSTTFVFANPPVSAANGAAAGGFVLELQNGASATITWPAAVDWPGGTAPTLTATGYDVLVFITDDGGTVWRGVLSMKDSK